MEIILHLHATKPVLPITALIFMRDMQPISSKKHFCSWPQPWTTKRLFPQDVASENMFLFTFSSLCGNFLLYKLAEKIGPLPIYHKLLTYQVLQPMEQSVGFVTLGSKSPVFLGRMASVCQVLLHFALSVSGSIFGQGRELIQIYSTSEGVFGSISPTNTPLWDRSDIGAAYLGWVLCIGCFSF